MGKAVLWLIVIRSIFVCSCPNRIFGPFGNFRYAGCNYDFKTYANFESSEKNRAYLINEDLCPKGKTISMLHRALKFLEL
jgi:hypothetical protein